MIAPLTLPSRLEHALAHPDTGVSGLVDELLAVACQREVRLDWRAGRCHVALLGSGTPDRIEVALPKAVIRSILARIAALCNERNLESVSPYGGRSELTIDADSPMTVQVAFMNTADVQSLELVSR